MKTIAQPQNNKQKNLQTSKLEIMQTIRKQGDNISENITNVLKTLSNKASVTVQKADFKISMELFP